MKRIFPIIQRTNCSFFHLHFVFKSSVNMIISCCFTLSGVAFHTHRPKEVIKFIVDVWFRANFIWGFIRDFIIQSVLIMIGYDHFIDFTVLFQSIFSIVAKSLVGYPQITSCFLEGRESRIRVRYWSFNSKFEEDKSKGDVERGW